MTDCPDCWVQDSCMTSPGFQGPNERGGGGAFTCCSTVCTATSREATFTCSSAGCHCSCCMLVSHATCHLEPFSPHACPAGLAINVVMILDTLFVSLVMVVGWRVRSPAVLLLMGPILALEGLLLSSNLIKVPHGEATARVCYLGFQDSAALHNLYLLSALLRVPACRWLLHADFGREHLHAVLHVALG